MKDFSGTDSDTFLDDLIVCPQCDAAYRMSNGQQADGSDCPRAPNARLMSRDR